MIDIHCHILPGIDDGAPDFETSLQILREAERAGVTDAVLTPHYIPGSVYNADNVKKWNLFQELRARSAREGINVNLYLGNEIYIDTRLPEMLGGYDLATLNSTKYFLVEFPVQAEDRSAKDTLFALIQKGYVPVIAHPERYFYVQENPGYMDDFLQMGCLLQGDYLALTGKYGKRAEKTLKKLIQSDKIFCLASDMHKVDDYKLDLAKKKLLKITRNEAKIERLLNINPLVVLKGRPE